MSKANKNRINNLVGSLNKQFGSGAGSIGSEQKNMGVIPTGSLSLDYRLGIGGWPRGYLSGAYGPRDIGKSAVIGLNAIREAQALGLNCAIVAVEPNFDPEWAQKHGVDTESLIIARPDTGEAAFEMLHKLTASGVVDLVVFDSIGALLAESEIDEGGKMKLGGQSGLITWGVKRVAPIAYKNEVCVIILNQVRDNMKARIPGLLGQPGGHALEHAESIIVQLKRGKDRYTLKIDGDDVVIGGQIIAHIQRNKMAEGANQKAIIDFYHKETEEYPFGIDRVADVVSIGKMTGVIARRGAYYDLPDGTTIQGMNDLREYINVNPDVYDKIRELVLKVMRTGASKDLPQAVEE